MKKKRKQRTSKTLGKGRAARGGRPKREAPKTRLPPIPPAGTVGWLDLTVPDADEARDFYAAVVGWRAEAVEMGDYRDYCMVPQGAGAPVAGVCHARGVNEGVPRCWLVYFMVDDVARSVAEVERRGGRVVRPAGPMGPMGRFAVVEDPAGAVCALFERAG